MSETRPIQMRFDLEGNCEPIPGVIERKCVAEPINNPRGLRVCVDTELFEEVDNLEMLVALAKNK